MNTTRIRAVILRHWLVLRRSPHRWFEISFWPIVDVLLWGSLGAYVTAQNRTAAASTPYLLAGLTAFWAFTQAEFSVALGFNEETWTRNILNVLTTPIREVEYLIGTVLFGLLKVVCTFVILTLVTRGFFHFDIGVLGWQAVPLIVLLMIDGWAIGLIAVALVLRFGQSADILVWGLNYVLLALSGVFFPSSSLPSGFRAVSGFLPTSRLFAGVRTLVTGGHISGGTFAAATVSSVAFLALTVWFTLRIYGVFHARGYVTRYS